MLMTPIVVDFKVWVGKYIEKAPQDLKIRMWWSQYQDLRGMVDWDIFIKRMSYWLKEIWYVYDTLVKRMIIHLHENNYEKKKIYELIKEFVKG